MRSRKFETDCSRDRWTWEQDHHERVEDRERLKHCLPLATGCCGKEDGNPGGSEMRTVSIHITVHIALCSVLRGQGPQVERKQDEDLVERGARTRSQHGAGADA